MESYRSVVTITAIKKHMDAGNAEKAYGLVHKLNVKRVNNIQDLMLLGEACSKTGHHDEAKEFYKKAYEKTGSKRALSQLVYQSIKNGQAVEARFYLDKYEEAAPADPTRLIYLYRIQKLAEASLAEQIKTLESWKEEEYTERWAYELAKLYHKAENEEKCLKECNDIILWFGEGKYVDWARTLRSLLLGEIDLLQLQLQQQEKLLAEEIKLYTEEETGTGEPTEDPLCEEPDVPEETESEEELPEETVQEEQPEEEQPEEAVQEEQPEEVPQAVLMEEVNIPEPEEPVSATPEVAEDEAPEDPDEQEETRACQEEAIRYMTEKLGGINTICLVNMKEDRNSKYQPQEDGELSRFLLKNELTLQDMFGNFACMDTVRKQLVRSLDIIFDEHKRGNNIIITGGKLTGKTTLAKRLAKMMYRARIVAATKVAIVDAERMNRVDLLKKQDALLDCCLIIENAGALKHATVDNLIALNPAFTGRTVVVLEDSRNNINKLLRDNPELNHIYNNRIHLPGEYRLKELKGFVYELFTDREYEIDYPADEVLDDLLDKLIKSKEENPIAKSLAIGKEAIAIAEKRTAKALSSLAESGAYENADIMVIRKEDMILVTEC